MIRPAQERDIPAMFLCAERFLAEEYEETADYASFFGTVAHLLNRENGRVYVVTVDDKIIGGAGVMFYPCWHDQRKRDAQELFWWINPEHRGGRDAIRLIDLIEKDAQDAGINRLMLTRTAKHLKVGRYYERRGYKETETTYARRLTCQPE